jgi:hypothetical protein
MMSRAWAIARALSRLAILISRANDFSPFLWGLSLFAVGSNPQEPVFRRKSFRAVKIGNTNKK